MTVNQRWEMGSSFPLMTPTGDGQAGGLRPGQLFGSGRQALMAIVLHGVRDLGWRKIHIPTYYCPDVVDEISRLTTVERYCASPLGDIVAPPPGNGEVVVVVSYFGQRPAPLRATTNATILDVTHDPLAPWILEYAADYVFASLRKTMPLPDGGVVWSSSGCGVPDPPAAQTRHVAATNKMLNAMRMKAAYLAGESGNKDAYMTLFHQAEAQFANLAPTSISAFSRRALERLPLHQWRSMRIDNIDFMSRLLSEMENVFILPSTFGVVLRFGSLEMREALRSAAISRSFYPAVLWDLGGERVPARQLQLSREMLFLHTDFRWSRSDLECAAKIVIESHADLLTKEATC